jgi:polyphosphate kinase
VFAQAAVRDPDVIAMKTAVYRTSDDSVLVGSLIQCAEEGKQSVCLVELKARFDELRNIEWSRELEQAGVHVAYGFPDLKIHAKMTLIVRREGDGLRRYVHIGTGNYHAATARLYEDLGVFTADEDITADVADLFNYITGFGQPQKFRKLLVAPFTLRSGLVDEIRSVAAAASEGRHARIRLKLNHLVDPKIVSELYAASRAGAQIDVIARSTCALRPGVEDLSENIRVRSIVGRFLEHSRIYSFEAGDRVATYIGSPDLMQRNLDHRVEVLMPVENARVRQEIHAVLDSALEDDTNAWSLGADGEWTRVEPRKSKRHAHHDTMMRRSLKRARRRARERRAG